jgi:hypothetical protein
MTTNLSVERITIELEKTKQTDSNIGITHSIAMAVDFLDVTIDNEDGQLKTTVFHKPATEPYILPFSSDHPRSNHRNIIHGGLLRPVLTTSESLVATRWHSLIIVSGVSFMGIRR